MFQGSWRWRFPGRTFTTMLWSPRWMVCTCSLFLEPVSNAITCLNFCQVVRHQMYPQIFMSYSPCTKTWRRSCQVTLLVFPLNHSMIIKLGRLCVDIPSKFCPFISPWSPWELARDTGPEEGSDAGPGLPQGLPVGCVKRNSSDSYVMSMHNSI